ncbi:MAG: hypothetical protein FWE84_00385 [Firmicutes bacterium]|nr:hypothetical protein [Bacillota bacterium]
MKKTVAVFAVILSIFCISIFDGCGNEYKNKVIVSIEFGSTDYMGGRMYNKFYDFQKMNYSTQHLWGAEPYPDHWEQEDIDLWDSLANYQVRGTFTEEKAAEFFENIKKHGIFELKKRYEPKELILDGGGWCLTITFDDGTAFTSSGSNCSPKQFKEIRKDFEILTGYELFE